MVNRFFLVFGLIYYIIQQKGHTCVSPTAMSVSLIVGAWMRSAKLSGSDLQLIGFGSNLKMKKRQLIRKFSHQF